MNPRSIVADFLAGEYRKLGRRAIEGVEAEGIEVTKIPNAVSNFEVDSEIAQLWVSIETGYPVMLESTTIGKGGKIRIEMTIDQFQWDVEFDPGQFKADIPPDFTLIEMPQQ
jgi:outer membrane lipoprotein-sorting protein